MNFIERKAASGKDQSKFGAFGKLSLKAVQSVTIASVCVTAGVVAGPAAQAAIGKQTQSDGAGNPIVSQRATIQAQAPLQYGKLKLRNDTESGAIIFLHAPGEETYSRYAYLPACSGRDLSAEYSTRWRVSVDAVHAHQISVVKGGVLLVATSSLVSQPDVTACNGGLRLQSRRVVATLTNRPQDYANIPRTTYRPVLFFSLSKVKETLGIAVARTSSKALKTMDEQERLKIYMNFLRKVDNQMLEMSAEVLSIAGRKVNVEDQRELIEVARFLKGNGSKSDLDRASARLEKYITDCYPAFANSTVALQFLTQLQTAQNLKTNLEDKASPLLIALRTNPSETETPNTSQPLKSVSELNDHIVTAPNGTQESKINGEGIKCVHDKPSITTHPSSTI